MSRSSSAIERQLTCRPPSRGGAVDGRSVVGRRCRELIATFTRALGGASAIGEGQAVDIRKAAELTALAEQARSRALRRGMGSAAELSAMVRLEGMADRAVRLLGIKPGTAQPKRKTLAEHLANRTARAPEVPPGEAA